MTVSRARVRVLGVTLAAVAVTALATVAYAQSAIAGDAVASPVARLTTADPPPSLPPTPEPTGTPTEAPTGTPTAEPTGAPTEPPVDECPIEPVPTPTELPEAPVWFAPARIGALAAVGPVTCGNRHSRITVSWDGKNIKIVIVPNPKFSNGICVLDPNSVKVIQPQGATVNANGSVEVPYDKTKNAKIVITIEYTINCPSGGFTTIIKDVATIEFTPPDGPLVVRNRPA
jgi:hypothetical protein